MVFDFYKKFDINEHSLNFPIVEDYWNFPVFALSAKYMDIFMKKILRKQTFLKIYLMIHGMRKIEYSNN